MSLELETKTIIPSLPPLPPSLASCAQVSGKGVVKGARSQSQMSLPDILIRGGSSTMAAGIALSSAMAAAAAAAGGRGLY